MTERTIRLRRTIMTEVNIAVRKGETLKQAIERVKDRGLGEVPWLDNNERVEAYIGRGWQKVHYLQTANGEIYNVAPYDPEPLTGTPVGELRVERDGVAVTLEYIGEGQDGDYDPEDEGDEPLMRIGVERLVDGVWEEVEDSSYCTQISVNGSEVGKKKVLEYVLAQVPQTGSVKRLMEAMSWIELIAQDGDEPDYSRVPC